MLRDNKEDGFSPGSMLHLWTAQTDAVPVSYTHLTLPTIA